MKKIIFLSIFIFFAGCNSIEKNQDNGVLSKEQTPTQEIQKPKTTQKINTPEVKKIQNSKKNGYSKNGENLFFNGEKIDGIDANSFKIISGNIGLYKNDFYCNGVKSEDKEHISRDEKYSNYYIYSNCGENNILFLGDKFYTISYSNKIFSCEELTEKSVDDEIYSPYVIFVESGDSDAGLENIINEGMIIKIFDLEKNTFLYSGKFIGELQYWMNYESGCFKAPITLNKLGYYLEDGIFDETTGKFYDYSDETKERMKEKYHFLSSGDGIVFDLKEIGLSRFGEKGFYDTILTGESCELSVNTQKKIDLHCHKDLLIRPFPGGLKKIKGPILEHYFRFIEYSIGEEHDEQNLEIAYKLKYQPTQSFEAFKKIYSNIANIDVLETISLGNNTYKSIVKIDGIKYESLFEIIDTLWIRTISTKKI